MSGLERWNREDLSRYQAAIAEYGRFALGTDELDGILQKATELAARGLGVELTKVLEFLPGSHKLLVRAGVGWKPGVVGHATLDAGQGSPAGYALVLGQPVISEDLATEQHYRVPELLTEHGVRSVVNVLICGHGSPFGVLEVDSRKACRFNEDDVNFLTCFANLIAAAIERAEITRQLKAAADTKARFLAAASHDLRQPVQAMSLLLDILKRRMAGHPAEDLVDMLTHSAEALRKMLGNLLDLSRLEAGTVTPVIVDFVVGDLLQRLVEEFQPMAQASGVRLELLPCSASVSSDPALLETIIRNLLSNAVKFTTTGRIMVTCRRQGADREIQVWDTGPGIPAEHLDEIFEEFRQLDAPGRAGEKGIGLGLAIVARTARLLGCNVSVQSEVGKGSVFAVTVPVAESHREAKTAVVETAKPETDAGKDVLAGRRVILVEDDSLILSALTEVFRLWGVDVIAAGSTADLVRQIETMAPPADLVITDHFLPGSTTGADVINLVRRHWPVPAVLMTGDTSPERRREADQSGWRLLLKPVEMAELRRILEELLR